MSNRSLPMRANSCTRMQKPDVDEIIGLSPAISIDQKSRSNNPRSTVATITEIYDYHAHPLCPRRQAALSRLQPRHPTRVEGGDTDDRHGACIRRNQRSQEKLWVSPCPSKRSASGRPSSSAEKGSTISCSTTFSEKATIASAWMAKLIACATRSSLKRTRSMTSTFWSTRFLSANCATRKTPKTLASACPKHSSVPSARRMVL